MACVSAAAKTLCRWGADSIPCLAVSTSPVPSICRADIRRALIDTVGHDDRCVLRESIDRRWYCFLRNREISVKELDR